MSTQRLLDAVGINGELLSAAQFSGAGEESHPHSSELDPLQSAGLRRRLEEGAKRGEQLPFELDPDIVTLFRAVEATRSDAEPYLLQFVAAAPGAGTSTIVLGFAVAASLEYSAPVLVLAAGGNGPSIAEAIVRTGSVEAAIESVPEVPRLYRARLSSSASPLREIEANDLRLILSQLRRRFAVVLVDSAAASTGSEALAISRFCDGTVLVVRAEHARRQAVASAREAIERFGGRVIGAVLNDRVKNIPPWLYKHL